MKRTPLKAYTPLKQKKPLNKRSKKTQKLYEEQRVPLVKRLLKERPWCEACKVFAAHDGLSAVRVRPSSDLHEIRSRGTTGGVHAPDWLDEDNILCVCRPCHRRITDNRNNEAVELKLRA